MLLSVSSILLALFFTASAAFAHAELQESNPAEGAVLSDLPPTLALTFGEDLLTLGDESVNEITLTNPNGTAIELVGSTVEGPVIKAEISSTEPVVLGRYVIAYRVVSADGHPVKGEISFELTAEEQVNAVPKSKQESTESPTPKSAGNLIFVIAILASLIILIISALLIAKRRR